MNIKKLEQSGKVLAKIKELDAEIVSIEKKAIRIASGEVKIIINIEIEEPVKEEDKGGEFEYGGYESFFSKLMMPGGFIGYKKTGNKEESEEEISDTLALQVLGVLLNHKLTLRDKLILNLKRKGIEL